MNGPEHYRRAEALLDSCQAGTDRDDEGRVVEGYPSTERLLPEDEPENTIGNALLAAHVHATLALAAATDPAVSDPNYASNQARLGPL